MRRTLVLLPLAALFFVTTQPAAAADRIEKMRGTVLAIDGIALTLEAESGATMSFIVDERTRVEAPGAGTATRRAHQAGQAGVPLSAIVKRGNSVEVTYREVDGIKRAYLVRRVWSSAGEPR
jgi:hypothetical protein